MKSYYKFLREAKDRPAVFSFGRFNPPTTGHAKLAQRLSKVARTAGGDPMIFTSHSNDKKKNPLPHKVKVKYLRKFFGKKIGVPDVSARTVFDIATALYNQGYRDIYMVVGSDRIREFDTLLKKYNSVKGRHGFYNFNNIEIVSAGERDADADDVSGMSASKMRAFAEKGDLDSFKQGVPSRNAREAEQLYKDVRKGMGIAEGNLPEYMMEDLITEGVYDPGIFKAVFLMGGPGSGKSTVVDGLALKSLGLKVVNTDTAFEKGLKKAGISLDLRKTPEDVKEPIRKKAKRITNMAMDMYIDSRLGLVFDTTSANITKIKSYKKLLDAIGYEYKMIFVNTSLEFAQQRNEARPRKLAPAIVQGEWEKVQKNAGDMKKLFKKDFIQINNDDTFKALQQKTNRLYGKMMSWVTSFPGNKLATMWKEKQLLAKKLGDKSKYKTKYFVGREPLSRRLKKGEKGLF